MFIGKLLEYLYCKSFSCVETVGTIEIVLLVFWWLLQLIAPIEATYELSTGRGFRLQEFSAQNEKWTEGVFINSTDFLQDIKLFLGTKI